MKTVRKGENMMTVIEISCVEAWRQISELIDDTLSPEMQARMERHLRGCAHCKAVYDGMLNTVQLIGDEEVFELPLGFSDRLFARLSEEFCVR